VSANVLVVDASGGGSYTQIQPAIDAADDGDTILVKSGSYTWFSVIDKSIAIVGDAGANVSLVGGARVEGCAASGARLQQQQRAVMADAVARHGRNGAAGRRSTSEPAR
jgi:pectin methylesterase-like acyl-CoA thioesterase